jgi:peptidoglycan hydrolase CwlO-like protein
MVTIDEKIIKRVEELTITDYEAKGNQVPVENIEAMIEDLLFEIEKIQERYNELDKYVRETYNDY